MPKVLTEQQVAQVAAKDVFLALDKTLRAYRMYAPGHQTIVEFEKGLFSLLSNEVNSRGVFTFGVRAFECVVADAAVYSNQEKRDNFAFRLYHDGVRQVTLHQGLELEELRRFVNILWANFDSYEFCDDDVVTLLWKMEFPHITVVVVETFAGSHEDAFALDTVVNDRIVEILKDDSPSSISDLIPTVRRRVRRADADEIRRLPELPDAALSFVEGFERDAILKQWAQDEEEMIRRIMVILFRVLLSATTEKETKPVEDTVARLTESLIRTGQLASAAKVISKLSQLADSQTTLSPKKAESFRTLHRRVARPELISEWLKATHYREFSKFEELADLLVVLGPSSFETALETIRWTPQENERMKLIPALANVGRDQSRRIAGAMSPDDPGLALPLLETLILMQTSDSLQHVRQASRHPHPRVRLRALQALMEVQPENKVRECAHALGDPDRTIRTMALKTLLDQNEPKTATILWEFTRSETFQGLAMEEKRQCFIAVGKLGGVRAIPIFSGDLDRGMLERSQADIDYRIAALWGLLAVGTAEARAVVERERDKTMGIREVREACEQILTRWPRRTS